MRLVLDSSFAIDHLRGLPEAVRRLSDLLEAGDEPIVTDVVVTEVWSGTGSDDVPAIEAFFRYMEFVQPGPATTKLAGRLRALARDRGRTLGLGDAMIAASAVHLGAAVLTRNVRDFALTPVRVETY